MIIFIPGISHSAYCEGREGAHSTPEWFISWSLSGASKKMVKNKNGK